MKSPPSRFGPLVALGLVIAGLPGTAAGQTIYAPYAITNLGGGPGGTFYFSSPYDVAVFHSTNIYVAATYDFTIRKLAKVGGTNWVMTTLAGSPNLSGTNDGIGANARFTYPEGVAVDSQGNVIVADSGNHTIRKITPAGNVTTLAGLGDQSGDADGTGSAARFSFPMAVAVDSADNIYVTDSSNYRIRKVTPGGAVTTVLAAPPMTVRYQGGLAIDAADNVYLTDQVRHIIYQIAAGGGVTIIAGSDSNPGSADGIGSEARFNVPNDVAVSANGDLFVSDAGNSTLRRLRFDGSNWVARTIAGTPGVFGSASGTGAAASFRNLAGLEVDDETQLLYAVDIVAGTLRVGYYVGPTNDFNSWTNTGHGKWEGSNYWSVGKAPSVQDQVNYVTNAGTKAVLIDETTPVANLTVNNLLVAAPTGDINALVLFDSGPTRVLHVKENLAIDSGGVIAITNGALKVGLNFGVGVDRGAAVLNLYNGGKLTVQDGYVGAEDSGGNAVSLNGPTSAWTNQNSFTLGFYSSGSGMLLENGAALVNLGEGIIGLGGDNNALVVTGPGTAFRNAGNLLIGAAGGAGNSLTVVNGGAVQVGYSGGAEMRIGGGGDGNVMTVSDAGSVLNASVPLRLVDSVAATYNALYISAGAAVTVPSLTVSNGNFVGLAGGTLHTAGTTINNGAVFPVGLGTDAATLHLNGGTHIFANGLLVSDHGLLTGCGTVMGAVTVNPGGTILADCGALIFAGPVTNHGTIQPLYGTNVTFQNVVINRGSILTNPGTAMWTCPVVVTGAIVNLNDSTMTTISDGTNSVQFNWSLAGPGASGYIYSTATTAIAAVTNVTSVTQITNAAAYSFLNSGNVGPLRDAGVNGGNAHFVLLRNKTTGHYCAVRMDDVQANGRLNASWWFQSQAGQTNFGCFPPPPPAGPQPAANFNLQSGGGDLTLSFATQSGRAYTVQVRTNLTSGPWQSVTNFPGDGQPRAISISPAGLPGAYYRVVTQ
jgi:hypothetical protein